MLEGARQGDTVGRMAGADIHTCPLRGGLGLGASVGRRGRGGGGGR